MILRLSQKLCKKIKEDSLGLKPLDENPYADWSSHLFVADRAQYILLTNPDLPVITIKVHRKEAA